MKPNKSFLKRLKMTRTGKIIGRKPGQNHFNAKERRAKQLNKKRSVAMHFKPKDRARFLS